MAGPLRDPDRHDIGAGSNRGEVATEHGAQEQGPPQHAAVPGYGRGELSDDRRHRGGIRNVVDEAAQCERDGEDQHGRRPCIAAG